MSNGIEIQEIKSNPVFVFRRGYFVKRGEDTYLEFGDGRKIPADRVAFVKPRANFTDNTQYFPRPFEVDSSGATVAKGDIVLVARSPFADIPIICFGAISEFRIQGDMDKIEKYERIFEVRENEERRYFIDDDGSGTLKFDFIGKNINGNITMTLTGADDENGRWEFNVSKDIAFNTPKIYLGEADNEEEPVILGRTFANQLKELLGKLAETNSIMTTGGPGQFNPVVTAQILNMKANIEGALSKKVFTT